MRDKPNIARKLYRLSRSSSGPESKLAREMAVRFGGFQFEEDETSQSLGVVNEYWRVILFGAIAKFYGCKVVRTIGDRKRATIRGLPSRIRDTQVNYARTVHTIVTNARNDHLVCRVFGNILAEEIARKVNKVKIIRQTDPETWPLADVAKIEKSEAENELSEILSDPRSPHVHMKAIAFAQIWLREHSAVKPTFSHLLPPWRPTMDDFFLALGDIALKEQHRQTWWILFASTWNYIGVVHRRTAPRSRWSILEVS